jgi:hypothetical protein
VKILALKRTNQSLKKYKNFYEVILMPLTSKFCSEKNNKFSKINNKNFSIANSRRRKRKPNMKKRTMKESSLVPGSRNREMPMMTRSLTCWMQLSLLTEGPNKMGLVVGCKELLITSLMESIG